MFCSKCGAQMADDAKFCGKCGAPAGASAGGEKAGGMPAGGTAPASGAAAKVDPFDYYKMAWQKYFVFEGRASRAEYWWFFLFNLLVLIAIGIVERMLWGASQPWSGMYHDDTGPISGLYQLAAFIPSLAVGIRRLHDSNHRGWWILLPIVNLVMLIIDGTPGKNRFGEDPKGRMAQQM